MQVLESSGPSASPAEAASNNEETPADTDAARPGSDAAFLSRLDASHARVCAEQRRFFSLIAEIDRSGVWQNQGAHDLAHWLRMRYGVSDWKARRWIASAQALESLPLTSEAFAGGRLGVDKVVELTRFATPETEQRLLPWACRVASATIREKGNELARLSAEQDRDLHEDRSFDWWHTPDGRQLQFEGRLPAAEGRVMISALERMTARLQVIMPEEQTPTPEQRRADALVAICSVRVATDPDPDRATVVVHVPVEVLRGAEAHSGSALDQATIRGPGRGSHPAGRPGGGGPGEPGCGLEGGGVMSVDTARRLACDARIETVLTGPGGWVAGLGRSSRDPSPQMVRALRKRDSGCRFPGCGTMAFTKAHHIRWWTRLGPTDMDNLVLLCSLHHKLVHELGWSLTLRPDNTVRFYRPDGREYRAGPGPPGTSPAEAGHAVNRARASP